MKKVALSRIAPAKVVDLTSLRIRAFAGKVPVAVCIVHVLLRLCAQTVAQEFPIATNPTLTEMSGGVVYTGTNYLVGYVAGTNILGQLISPVGQLLGAPYLVASANLGFPPAVAFASGRTNCLVAWSDYSRSTEVTMFGRIINFADGTMGPVFPLLSAVGTHGFQRVRAATSDGTNYLVLWVDAHDEIDDGVYTTCYGQFVTAAGTLLGAEFAAISGATLYEDLAVRFGNTNYLLAWQSVGGDDSHETYCRVISPAGALGVTYKISETTSDDRNPVAIGFDGTNFLVLWNCTTNYDGPGELMLYGRRVSQTGAPLGSELVISTNRTGFPGVAFDGANYLVVWAENVIATNHTVHARFIDRAGNPIGPVITPLSTHGTNAPLFSYNGVFFGGGKFIIAATYGSFLFNQGGDIVGMEGDLYGRFFPSSITPPWFMNPTIAGGYFNMQFNLVPGVAYALEISTNLTSWQFTRMVSSGETNVLYLQEERLPEGNVFFRARSGLTP